MLNGSTLTSETIVLACVATMSNSLATYTNILTVCFPIKQA